MTTKDAQLMQEINDVWDLSETRNDMSHRLCSQNCSSVNEEARPDVLLHQNVRTLFAVDIYVPSYSEIGTLMFNCLGLRFEAFMSVVVSYCGPSV